MRKSSLIFFEEYNRECKPSMKRTAIIEREGDGYVSSCPELDLPSRGKALKKRGTIFEKHWNFSLKQHHPNRLNNVFTARFSPLISLPPCYLRWIPGWHPHKFEFGISDHHDSKALVAFR